MNTVKISLCAALALAPLALRAEDAPLAPYRAEYALSRNGSAIGTARARLSRAADGTWEFSTVSAGTHGLAGMVGAEINEVTRFRYVGGKPELIESRLDQKVAFKDRHRHITVDASRGRVHSEDEKRSGDLAFTPNLLDRHATVLALAIDSAHGAKDFDYTVADRQKIESNLFRAAGRETVTTPSGRYEAERIERIRTKNKGRVTTSWLAPELGYVAVRMVQTEPDGETLEMNLVKLER